jgi:hypothetical protein
MQQLLKEMCCGKDTTAHRNDRLSGKAMKKRHRDDRNSIR